MSRIDELIERLCPDGVEFKALSEVGVLTRGKRFCHKDAVEQGVPCIHYGELYTHYGVWSDAAKSHVRQDMADKLRYAKTGDVVIVGAGEKVDDIGIAVAWLGGEDVAVHDACYILSDHGMNPKFVSYFLRTKVYHSQIRRFVSSGKISSISAKGIGRARIPVPPMEVQEEIVRVLDSFAELEARRKQYAYYSKRMIEAHPSCVMVELGNLGKWTSGKTPSMAEPRYWRDGHIPWVSAKDMKTPCLNDTHDHISDFAISDAGMKVLPEGSIATVTRSGILKHTFPVAYLRVPMAVNQDIKALVPSDGYSGRYLALAMQAYAEDIRTKTKKQGGTVDSLDFAKVKKFAIPIPSFEQQIELANKLDKFDAFVNDITQGLPAEIEARRKQYEYYRDRLLTFKEKAS